MAKGQRGYTLVEVLVALAIFGVISSGFYMVLYESARGASTAEDVNGLTQEAQLGLGRIVRDVRQADNITDASSNSFTVQVDFDGNGAITPDGSTNAQGDYEVLTYSYSNAAHTIRLNGELLMRGARCLTQADGSCYPVFDYYSDHLEYDANGDGVTTWQELDSSGVAGVGNGDGILDGPELGFISSVAIAFDVGQGDSTARFSDQAQLRNQR